MSKLLSTLKTVLTALGAVVDAAIPVANGDRTKIAAVVAVTAPVVSSAACSLYAPACPVIDAVGKAAAALIPVFAAAGLTRKL